MQKNESLFPELDNAIKGLNSATDKRAVLAYGLSIADEFMHILGIPYDQLDKGEDELNKAFPASRFRNQKMETWFAKHPYFGNARVALDHYDKGKYPIESKFYELADSPRKERIAAISQLFPNWEDSELTMMPQYKVGIDFFLSPKRHSVLVVLSKRRNLRVLELSDHLTHTQIQILRKIQGVALLTGIDPKTGTHLPLEPQKTIHETLWSAFELREVNKDFYAGISEHFTLLCQFLQKNPPSKVDDVKQSAQIFACRLIGRLLFVWFLRKKNIINEKGGYFDFGSLSSSDYYSQKLKTLFFNTLNKPIDQRPFGSDQETPYLNGGLFEAHPSDWPDKEIKFPEGWFQSLYKHFEEYNFTTDESSPEYEQVAIDPEMLGRVFENLLASIVPETSKAASERNNKGAFYTPREIVSYMCKISLKEYLKRHISSDKDYPGIDKLIDLSDSEYLEQRSSGMMELWGNRSTEVKQKLIEILNQIKILDPACGSGAFPIGMMQLLIKIYDRLSAIFDPSIKKMRYMKSTERNDLYATKLFIIQNNIFGVDIEPMAVEIARLRAWLSLIIDDKKDVDPLPNLDFNFTCANSLVPMVRAEQTGLLFNQGNFDERIAKFKEEYFNAHSIEKKKKLRQDFLNLKKDIGDSYDVVNDPKSKEERNQLLSWDLFDNSKPSIFFDPKTMFNVDSFDLVIGNPPYINFNDIKEDSHKIYAPLHYQTYKATGDIYCLFIERGIKFLKPKGILTYITSNKWLRAGYGEATRGFLAQYNPLVLIDFGGIKVFDSATVDTDILVVGKENNQKKTLACKVENNCLDNLSLYVQQKESPTIVAGNKPWLILNKIEKGILEKMENNRVQKLSSWNISIKRGVLTGLNSAFIINEETRKRLLIQDSKCAEIIRPILRGEDIKKYCYSFKNIYLINSNNGNKQKGIPPIDINKYPVIKKYLSSFEPKLSKRADQGDTPYNLRNCVYMDDFLKPKNFYREIDDEMDAVFIMEPIYANNKCYIVTGDHLEYLTAFFNSILFKKIYLKYVNLTGGKGSDFIKNISVPLPSLSMEKEIAKLVNKIQHEKTLIAKKEISLEIDEIFFKLSNLTAQEIEFLRS